MDRWQQPAVASTTKLSLSVVTTCQINQSCSKLAVVDYLGVSVLIIVAIDCVVVLSRGLTPLQCTTLDLTKLAKQFLSDPSQSNNSQAIIIGLPCITWLFYSEGARGLAWTTWNTGFCYTSPSWALTQRLFNSLHIWTVSTFRHWAWQSSRSWSIRFATLSNIGKGPSFLFILRDTGIKQRRTVLISIPVITLVFGGSIGVDFPLYGKANRNSYPDPKLEW